MSPAYHHGRCCPARVVDGLAAQGSQVGPSVNKYRKEARLKAIETWIAAEKDTSQKLSVMMNKIQETDYIRNHNMDATLAKQEGYLILAKHTRCLKKLEMLTKMFAETVNSDGKLYGHDPASEWINEFRLKWEKDGTKYEEKVNAELRNQAQGLTLKNRGRYWRVSTPLRMEQQETPSPNTAPSPMRRSRT